MFSKIMYVTVFVTDQDKVLDFYMNSLGFQKHADYSGPEGRFLTTPSRIRDSKSCFGGAVRAWQMPRPALARFLSSRTIFGRTSPI
jgi:catechol 2,3-dioxygenase-like lactoylglutathione lyase family enzyme